MSGNRRNFPSLLNVSKVPKVTTKYRTTSPPSVNTSTITKSNLGLNYPTVTTTARGGTLLSNASSVGSIRPVSSYVDYRTR